MPSHGKSPRGSHPQPSHRPQREVRLAPGVPIIHEDADVIVVEKPTGMLTARAEGQLGDSLFDLVKTHARKDRTRRGEGRVWVVHRLDREVSGLVVFAKSERAFAWLKEEFRTKRAGRIYAAVVESRTGPGETLRSGTIRTMLAEAADGRVRVLPAEAEQIGPEESKSAVTHWKELANANDRSLLRVQLETGRKHQIRAHLAHAGMPVCGDRKYGARTDPVGRICLHAAVLSFSHPATGETVTLQAPVPGQLRTLVGVSADADVMADFKPDVLDAPAAARPSPSQRPQNAHAGSWEHVAEWYDGLISQRGSDHHENVILPGTLRLLAPKKGDRVLDLACGQGLLSQRLAAAGCEVVGVDAAPKLIEAANRARIRGATFVVGDARELPTLNLGLFDRVACVMALMNIEPLAPVMQGVASLLKPGGVFASVILHPAFRAPGQTSWSWHDAEAEDEAEPKSPAERPGDHRAPRRGKPGAAVRSPRRPGPAPQSREHERQRLSRRVDGYLSPKRSEIVMNPGAAASGAAPIVTWTYHRPVQAYAAALSGAGLLIDAIEEWPSLRVSQPGPRAAEENRARREIPMFLCLRAVKPRG